MLPLVHFLGRSDTVVAVLLEVHAYTVGLGFRLTYGGRGRRSSGHPPFIPTHPRMTERLGTAVASSPEVAVLLADGTEAMTLDRSAAYLRLDELTDEVVLIKGDGGGGNDQLDASYWLTPNPHAGVTLRFRLVATATRADRPVHRCARAGSGDVGRGDRVAVGSHRRREVGRQPPVPQWAALGPKAALGTPASVSALWRAAQASWSRASMSDRSAWPLEDPASSHCPCSLRRK